MVYYSKVHETVLVSPSVAAASAALTEYLVLTTVVSVLFSDDELPEEELPDDELPEDEPPDDGLSHGGEEQAAKQAPILAMLKNIINAINFFMNLPFQNLRIIVCSVDFKLF